MPKKLPALDEYLAPWEVNEKGEKLDEPAELDPERLKKYLHGLLSDKESLQGRVTAAETERDDAKTALTDLQRQVETDDERRAREDKEREERFEAMERRDRERAKFDALVEHFKDQGITADRARRLAKRVDGDDEKAWLESADELVEDGFRITDKAQTREVEQDDDSGDDDGVSVRPKRVVRSDGQPVETTASRKNKAKSVTEELDLAGIGASAW